MNRVLALSLLSACLSLSSGCAMCCAPFDCNYQSVAGRWSRFNPSNGRVGSAFDEAGGPTEGVPVATATTQAGPIEALPPPQMAPSAMPGGRSVLPRNMGQSYLPNGQ
jgi:hypothetical protein